MRGKTPQHNKRIIEERNQLIMRLHNQGYNARQISGQVLLETRGINTVIRKMKEELK